MTALSNMGDLVSFKNAEGSMAKLKAGRVAVWFTERAMADFPFGQICRGNRMRPSSSCCVKQFSTSDKCEGNPRWVND